MKDSGSGHHSGNSMSRTKSNDTHIIHVGMNRLKYRRVGEILGNAFIRRPLEHSHHATRDFFSLRSLSRILLALEVTANHDAQQRNRHATSHVDGIGKLRE